jgi:hypothetical protein
VNRLNEENCYKYCHMINKMSLYRYFKVHELINMICNVNEFIYFFTDCEGNVMMKLVDAFITK